MKKILFVLILFAFIISCTQNQEEKIKMVADADNGGLTLPEGFSALVVANETGKGRHIDVNTNGDFYVALSQQSDKKGIACLRDTTGDGKANIIVYTGKHLGTGIKLHKGYLYFGADTAVVRYPMTDGELLPKNNWEMIARGFPDERQHEAK